MTTKEKAKAYADKKIKSTYGISSKVFREAGCRLEYEDVVQAYLAGAAEATAKTADARRRAMGYSPKPTEGGEE